jgi:hypothetical protein
VGKPNASLSADRRGTLSIPDLCSFVLDVSKSGEKGKKKTRKDQIESFEEEILSVKGSKSRPRTTVNQLQVSESESSGLTNGEI